MSASDKLKAMFENKANENLKAGEDFLAENAKRENVVTLPSGLQYEIIKQGDGPKPLANNTVTCHYHGTTIKGEVFDSSVRRGQPASFPLNAVIKGWTEALQLMPTGSKWKLFIPPQLAYGNRNISREIGPNSTLIFEVELLSFR
jgi:FKBP-type peptidyl-prolyl cis-trans isomerase FklB